MQNLDKMQLNEKIASIVLAGGLGTRLHPLTLHRCKPAVCFGGKYRLIDIPISNSLNSQISQIQYILHLEMLKNGQGNQLLIHQ